MEKFRGSTKNNNLNICILTNRHGQLAIEAVLLMTVLIGLFLALTSYLKKNEVVRTILVEPASSKLNTMTGFGTWKPDGCTAPGKSKQTLGKCHPNSIHRSLSSDPGL